MKMKRKQIGMLVFIAIIVILMVVTSQTPGTIADADSYQCKVYATILSLLPPVIAIGLALITKEVLYLTSGRNYCRWFTVFQF